MQAFRPQSSYFTRPEAFADGLQQEIDDWLAARASIWQVRVLQSTSGGNLEPTSLTVSVWYEDQ